MRFNGRGYLGIGAYYVVNWQAEAARVKLCVGLPGGPMPALFCQADAH